MGKAQHRTAAAKRGMPKGNRPDTQDPFQNPALALLAVRHESEDNFIEGNRWGGSGDLGPPPQILSQTGDFWFHVSKKLTVAEMSQLSQAIQGCFQAKGIAVSIKDPKQAQDGKYTLEFTATNADVEAIGGAMIEICDRAEQLRAAPGRKVGE
jgi:hypothetical protein